MFVISLGPRWRLPGPSRSGHAKPRGDNPARGGSERSDPDLPDRLQSGNWQADHETPEF
jgi:hypothetical protein